MDELSRLDSPIHRLDARIKALTTFAFIVAVMSFPRHEISALMPFFIYPCLLISMSGIPPACILRKLLVAAPFALAVGMFNPLLDRSTAATLGPYAVSGGWISFASIAIRSALTITAALTLIACTGINRLCAGLERMGLPQVFSFQLQLLYRYLFVITGEGLRMNRSVELRSTNRRAMTLRTYGALLGSLLLRSIERAQRIYQAMVARGFDGRIRVLHADRLRPADLLFLFFWLAFFATARFWNLSGLLGRLITGAQS